MRIKPLMTEKSLEDAKNGKYSFWVPKGLNKYQIKALVEESFGVHVTGVSTQNMVGRKRRNVRGVIQTIKPKKKAIVTLRPKEKIDLFETKE